MARWRILLASVVLGPAALLTPAAGGGELRVGAATSNITPALGGPIVGNFATPPATHVHDELLARCLVLDDGRTTLALAICDNLGLPRPVLDEARALVTAELGIPPAHILLASTHTHSATAARPGRDPHDDAIPAAYGRFVARRIADGIRRAWNQRTPALARSGSFDLPGHVFNRRWLFEPGQKPPLNPFGGQDQALMNPGVGRPGLREPAGPVDPQVSFVAFSRADDRGYPIAVLANYSLHYVGGVPDGHVSADYFGAFAAQLTRQVGGGTNVPIDPPFVAILSNGTSGDVNNIDVRRPAAPLPPYAKIDQVARELADALKDRFPKFRDLGDVTLAAATRELTLQTRRPTDAEADAARAKLAKPEDAPRVHPLERVYANRVLELRDAPPTETVLIQALRVGDVGIAAIPFEVFAETGLAIRKASPLRRTFTIELANGSSGYLPTPRQHALGGYETWMGTNRVEVAASDKIEAAVLDLLRQVAAAPPAP